MKKVIFVILILFFTFSCEYQTEDAFFVKKEEPLPNKEVEINLAGVQPKDTIYVYQKTLFSYSLNIPDKDILKNVMKLDGTPINDNGWSLFLIEPEEFDNSIHKLTLSVELRTNTNSLAEKLGLEKYIGEYEYILKYVKVNHDLQIKDDITDDSYLKIVWAKPLIEGLAVEKYEVTYDKDWSWNSKITITITDPDQTFIVDKNYVYGYKDYEIKTYFKDNKIDTWVDRYTMSYQQLDGNPIRVEEISIKEARVSWTKNKYRCSYRFKNMPFEPSIEVVKDLDYSVNSQVIDISYFPNPIFGALHVLPQNYDNAFAEWGRVDFYGDIYPSLDRNWDFFQFSSDINKKALYGLGVYKIIKFDAESLNQLKIKWIDNLNYHYTDKISSSSITSKTAALSKWGVVYVLDEDLNLLKQFDISKNTIYESLDDVFCITDDNKIVVSGMGHSRELYVYNVDGTLKYEISLPATPFRAKITSSSDGKYLCYYTSQNIKIYELGESSETLIYDHDVVNLDKCDFHPTIKNKMIFQYSSKFCSFDILKSTESDNIKGSYISIDPFTGNTLYYDENYKDNRYVNIMEPNENEIVGQIKLSENYDVRLYNNRLMNFSCYPYTSLSYYRNLSKYLK